MIDARYQVLFLLGVLWAPVRANDDPCHSYQPITDEWRNINYGQKYFCDITHRWHGWYRFMGRAGNKMPDSAPSQRHCGTSYPIWLSGGHPKVSNGIVSRRLCTYYSSYTCTTSSQHGAFQVYEYAKVKKCPGGYYVYQLPNLQFTCNRAFCAVKDTSDPCLDSNCTYGCVNQNGQAQCTCPANVLNSNRNQSCVSPCSGNNGGCSHTCRSQGAGSKTCECPETMELDKNQKTCVDPCKRYKLLDQEWRNAQYGSNYYCDDLKSFEGWYRFVKGAGNRMADSCVSWGHCGGNGKTRWLLGGHPTVKDGIVKRNICTRSSSSRCSCYFNSHTTFDYAMVRKCPGGYYVYKFPQFQWQYCHVNICGVTDTSDPCLNSTCTHGCTGDKGSPVCTCPRNLVLAEDKNTCISPCDIHNGGCSHSCHSDMNATITCTCPPSLVLARDKKICVTPCLYQNGGCSHFCVADNKGKISCGCPANLVLAEDKETCISTCRINNGGCSHNCTDSNTGAICSCPVSWELGNDKLTCDQDANECKRNPCSQHATCINTRGSFECVCNVGYAGDGLNCHGEKPTDTNIRRCRCRLRAETNSTAQGPILFDLPTLIYGHKTLWATDMYGNDSAAYVITDKYSNFYNTRRKRDVIDNQRDLLTCLKVLRKCPADCERLARIIVGDNLGLDTRLLVENSAQAPVYKAMGQIMCETYNHHIDPPGKRVVVFYNPGEDCGEELSTYASKTYLCCNSEDIFDLGQLTFWNRKCKMGMNLRKLLVG